MQTEGPPGAERPPNAYSSEYPYNYPSGYPPAYPAYGYPSPAIPPPNFPGKNSGYGPSGGQGYGPPAFPEFRFSGNYGNAGMQGNYGGPAAGFGGAQGYGGPTAGFAGHHAGFAGGAQSFGGYNGGYSGNAPYMGSMVMSQYSGEDRGQPTHTIWIGGLNGIASEQELNNLFSPFGNIEKVKILPQKNCGFVRYVSIEDAMRAHTEMSGTFIGGQPIKLGWGKPDSLKEAETGPPCKNLWVGNVDPICTEDQVRELFKVYGPIEKIRLLPHKNCAFVNFETLESALEAKKQMQGNIFMGKPLRVNFGRTQDMIGEEEEELITSSPQALSQPLPPTNTKQKDIIDKLALYVVKNGPSLEAVTRENQKNNPIFSFLTEGGEYYEYYKWKIFDTRQRQKETESPWVMARRRIFNPPNSVGKQLSSEDKTVFSQILDTLAPTKESIKKAKDYVMSKSDEASSVCHFMCMKILDCADFMRKLNIIYLANDVLHHSAKINLEGVNLFAEAMFTYLPCILYNAYTNQPPENQAKLTKLLTI